MYKQIYEKIKELLETIPEIMSVNTFNNGNFEAFPAINITSISKSRDWTSTCTIEENGTISLILYQEINKDGMGAVKGESIVLDIIDQIDDLFDANYSLGGLVDSMTLSNAELGFVDRELNYRTYNITLSYKLLKQVLTSN